MEQDQPEKRRGQASAKLVAPTEDIPPPGYSVVRARASDGRSARKAGLQEGAGLSPEGAGLSR